MSHPETLDIPETTSSARPTGRTVCIPIAIDHGLESKLLNHFGSAPLFAIVDVDAGTMTTLGNDASRAHGGCAPVEAIASQRVDAVIVGGIGGGAIRRLSAYNIQVLKGRPGPISALIDEYKNGSLESWDPSDGCADHNHGHQFQHGRS